MPPASTPASSHPASSHRGGPPPLSQSSKPPVPPRLPSTRPQANDDIQDLDDAELLDDDAE
jgi:hypothetical protein